MENNKHILRFLIFILIIAVTFSSCKKEEVPEYAYYVSSELVFSFSEANINAVLGDAVLNYPELADVEPFVSDGINVHRIHYKTNVAGEDIEASGLIITPATPGEYPVLSFQNGTNTVDAYAPSNYPASPDYMMIEFMASMGFIVVIPDYPGFGSSSEIPHPYLIAEPTVRSITDMFYALGEAGESHFPGISIKNEYYLIGYSQGGWATMTLHKALELDFSDDFNLAGSVCGAGPYNMYNMFLGISSISEYPMPSYLCYIINAYKAYNQFTNPVSDILNPTYVPLLSSLYNGTLSLGQINSQLTTSVPGLFKSEFISGFATSPDYASVREALNNNSVVPYHTYIPLLLVHGEGDTHVSPSTTEILYTAMINAGTSESILKKITFPGLDHSEGVVPSLTEGLLFIKDLMDN